MPLNSNDNVLHTSPDPAEVMLFFEMIDERQEGTVSVESLAKHISEVECFVENNCDYNQYLNNKNDTKKQLPLILKNLDKLIGEISLKEDDFLTPEEFYNLIVAAAEINSIR